MQCADDISAKRDQRMKTIDKLQTSRSRGRPRSLSLGDAIVYHRRWLIEQERKPKTISTNEERSRHLVRILGEHFQLSKLVVQDIQDYKTQRRAEGVSQQTVNNELDTLYGILNNAERQELLSYVPVRVDKLRFKIGQSLVHVYTEEQTEKILIAANEGQPIKNGESVTRTALAILIAAYSGLRLQEIRHLRWLNVNLKLGLLNVLSTKNWTTKAHNERSIPIPTVLVNALKLRKDESPSATPEDWIFPGRHARTPFNQLGRDVRAAVRQAGLYIKGKTGLHGFRRTWATNLGERVDLPTLKEWGGWADFKTPGKYIRAKNPERKRSLVCEVFDTPSENPLKSSPEPAVRKGIDPEEIDELVSQNMTHAAAIAFLRKQLEKK